MKENIKEKLKSYEFWVSVASAVMVLLQTISIRVDIPYINEVTMAFLSLLTVAGILKKNPSKQNVEVSTESGDISDTQKTESTLEDREEKDESSKDYTNVSFKEYEKNSDTDKV